MVVRSLFCAKRLSGDAISSKFYRAMSKKHAPLKSKVKLEGKAGEFSETASVTSTDIKSFRDFDSLLQVSDDELDLERTLLGGQSFRWNKYEKNIGDSKVESFIGVVRRDVLQLWRVSPQYVAFKKLNYDAIDVGRKEIIEQVESSLHDYFQLKYRVKDLYEEWSSKDPHLSSCCQHYKGFRILRQDPEENLFSFICATNNNIKRISQMIDKMCKQFGDKLDTLDVTGEFDSSYHSFPSTERLAQDDVFESLRHKLGYGYRAKFITGTAKLLLTKCNKDGARDYLLSLRQLPYKDTCKTLMQFPGIGRKVADCICLMSMDHLNSVPIDCHIYEIVCRHYLPDLRRKYKTLTESVHDLIGDYFKSLHGPLAGWSTSVLFIAELKHLKTKVATSCDGSKTVGGKRKIPSSSSRCSGEKKSKN